MHFQSEKHLLNYTTLKVSSQIYLSFKMQKSIILIILPKKPEYKLFSVVLDRKGVIGWKKPVTFESMEEFNACSCYRSFD